MRQLHLQSLIQHGFKYRISNRLCDIDRDLRYCLSGEKWIPPPRVVRCDSLLCPVFWSCHPLLCSIWPGILATYGSSHCIQEGSPTVSECSAAYQPKLTMYRQRYAWVLIMGAVWELLAFIFRALQTRHQDSEIYSTLHVIFFLLAPICEYTPPLAVRPNC